MTCHFNITDLGAMAAIVQINIRKYFILTIIYNKTKYNNKNIYMNQ